MATIEALVPLANDRNTFGRLILSFWHLKHWNLSTGDDFINFSGIIYLVQFLANKEAFALLVNDPIILGRLLWSFRHLEHQNLYIVSDVINDWSGCKIRVRRMEDRTMLPLYWIVTKITIFAVFSKLIKPFVLTCVCCFLILK